MLYDLGPRARRVYSVLRERITSGQLAPGSRLPAHARLAATFGVAPLTMRHVLARLEADRLVARERGRGTFVRAANPPDVLIVAWNVTHRQKLLDQVHRAGRHATLAATAAEGLAALDREPSVAVLVVSLPLPTPGAGLAFVRAARRQRSSLPIVVLEPTPGQNTRLLHTLAPPALSVTHADIPHLAHALRTISAQPTSTADEPVARAPTRRPSASDLMQRYLAVQLAGERVAARHVVLEDGLAAGVPVAELYLGVLGPSQHHVGQLWQRNEISIAREHLATAITASVMADVAAAAPRAASTSSRVLVACVEEELHDLGARMVADLLELDGFDVRFVGANVPTPSLLAMLAEEQPRLVVLSATMPEHLPQLRQAVAGVRELIRERLPVFVGGQVVDWVRDLAEQVDADLVARDARQTLQAARTLLLDPTVRLVPSR